MTSEIRVNKLENRVGLGTIEYSNTGPVISGVTTASNFKTGSSNLHSSGVEVAGVNTLGADTPIGLGATIYNSGDVIVGGAITATNFVGGLPIAYGVNNRVITASSASAIQGEQNLTFDSSTLAVTGNITATGNFVANGSMTVGSYGVFGSLVAADPGSNYYGTSNRFGGGLSLQGSLYIDGDIIHVGDTNTKIRFPVNDNISLETAGVQRFRLNEVGISTFYNSQLHIEGAGSGNVPLTINTDVAVNNSVHPLIQAYSDNATYKTQIGLVREASSGNLGWAFLTNAIGSPTERLRITSTGEIKQYGFTGTSDTAADDLVLGNTTDGVNRGITIWSHSSQNGSIAFADNDSNFRGAVQYIHNGDILRFLTAGDERLRITSDGKVGIGEDNPSTILHVENNNANASTYYLNTDAAILVQNNNSNATAKTVLKLEAPGGGGDCAFVYGASATNLIISDRQNERLRIASSGYVQTKSEFWVGGASPVLRLRDTTHGEKATMRIDGSSHLYFEVANQERFRIDTSGRVVVGGTNAYIGGAALAVMGTSHTPNTYGSFAIGKIGANPTANTTLANIRLNGGSVGTRRGAEINAIANGNWTDGSSHPTNLTFAVAKSGSASATQRVMINSYGHFQVTNENVLPSGSTVGGTNGFKGLSQHGYQHWGQRQY